jgi:hypothetical protein
MTRSNSRNREVSRAVNLSDADGGVRARKAGDEVTMDVKINLLTHFLRKSRYKRLSMPLLAEFPDQVVQSHALIVAGFLSGEPASSDTMLELAAEAIAVDRLTTLAARQTQLRRLVTAGAALSPVSRVAWTSGTMCLSILTTTTFSPLTGVSSADSSAVPPNALNSIP